MKKQKYNRLSYSYFGISVISLILTINALSGGFGLNNFMLAALSVFSGILSFSMALLMRRKGQELDLG